MAGCVAYAATALLPSEPPMPHRRPARFAVAHVAFHAALGLSLAGLGPGFAGPAGAQARAAAYAGGHPGSAAPTKATPDPRLAADEVVGIVLAALGQASHRGGTEAADDQPIALAYAFASPANRAAVGTLERFAEMVRDDAYRPLLGHRQATRGVARVQGDRATQRVVVTAADGGRVAYTFTLARQLGGAYRGCWMTESVVREAPSRVAAGYAA